MKVQLTRKAIAFIKQLQDDLKEFDDKQLLLLALACSSECKERGLTK